jgi:hypothetical protein
LFEAPHRQVVFTIPKALRTFFKFRRRLLADRINFHPHPHFPVREGGVDGAGVFRRIPRLGDSRLAAIFCREELRLLVGKPRSKSAPKAPPPRK